MFDLAFPQEHVLHELSGGRGPRLRGSSPRHFYEILNLFSKLDDDLYQKTKRFLITQLVKKVLQKCKIKNFQTLDKFIEMQEHLNFEPQQNKNIPQLSLKSRFQPVAEKRRL